MQRQGRSRQNTTAVWGQSPGFSSRNIHNIFEFFYRTEVVLVVKNLPAKAGEIRDVSPIPGLGRYPGEGQPSPLFLLREAHGQRSPVGYNSQGCKSQTWLKWLSMYVQNQGRGWQLQVECNFLDPFLEPCPVTSSPTNRKKSHTLQPSDQRVFTPNHWGVLDFWAWATHFPCLALQ